MKTNKKYLCLFLCILLFMFCLKENGKFVKYGNGYIRKENLCSGCNLYELHQYCEYCGLRQPEFYLMGYCPRCNKRDSDKYCSSCGLKLVFCKEWRVINR